MKRVVELTRSLKRYDKRLYAKYYGDGIIQILYSDANINKLVMALTDNWSMSGRPVPWGYMPILERLQMIDASTHDVFGDIVKNREKIKESSDRHFSSELESGLKEQRRAFAKSFGDYNTSTCNKKYDKRRKKGA